VNLIEEIKSLKTVIENFGVKIKNYRKIIKKYKALNLKMQKKKKSKCWNEFGEIYYFVLLM
jgi:hypothetical protein